MAKTKKKGGKRKVSAYNRHVARVLRAGGTMKHAWTTWKGAKKAAVGAANKRLKKSKSKVKVKGVTLNPGRKRKGRRKGRKASKNPGRKRKSGRRASRNPLPVPAFLKQGIFGKILSPFQTGNLKDGAAVLAGAIVATGAPSLFGAWNSGWKGLVLSMLAAGAASAVAAKVAPRYAASIATGGVVVVGLRLVQQFAPRAMNWSSGMAGFMRSRGGLAGFLPTGGRVAGFLPTPARMSGVAASGGEVFRGTKY